MLNTLMFPGLPNSLCLGLATPTLPMHTLMGAAGRLPPCKLCPLNHPFLLCLKLAHMPLQAPSRCHLAHS